MTGADRPDENDGGSVTPMPERDVPLIPIDDRSPVAPLTRSEVLRQGIMMVPNLAKLLSGGQTWTVDGTAGDPV